MNEPSLGHFAGSLYRNTLDNVRQNKLAATMAVAALLVSSSLALNSHYDERDRYRRVILPDIERAETQFDESLDAAEHAINEPWRLHYFIRAHNRAKDVLNLAKSQRPRTQEGISAHNSLIRYYELASESLAIIRTEMSIDEELDYLNAWRKEQAVIQPIHDRWKNWVK